MEAIAPVSSYELEQSDAAFRRGLIRAAAYLGSIGRKESEQALLRSAACDCTNPELLSMLADAALNALDLDLALSAYRDLIRLQPLYAVRLTSPLENLVAFDILSSPVVDPVWPIPRRACYIVHYSLPYVTNGYATRGHGLAQGIQQAQLDLVCLSRPGFPHNLGLAPDSISTSVEDTIDGVTYHRLPAVNNLQAAADLIEARLRYLRPQVAMAASNYETALPALVAARRTGLPFVYEVRGFWGITHASLHPESLNTSDYRLAERIESELACHADHVFTLCASMANELQQRGVKPERITLLPNGCDTDRFKPLARDTALAAQLDIPENVPVIGYVGSFNAYEGLEELVQACVNLRRSGMEFRLLLVGNEARTIGESVGSVTTAIRSACAEEALGNWLIMPGRVPHDQVEAFYSLIDIAPFPRRSLRVTDLVSPLKPLEAMSMEKAVIVSSVIPLAEMVSDGITGLIFPSENVDELGRTLGRLIVDPTLRKKLGTAARHQVIAERSWQQIGLKATALLSRIAAAG